MATYQAFLDFTAQSRTVRALMNLYRNLEKSEDEKVELTPIVVFIAFSIESYLNSLGARQLDIWDELERLPWKKKVEILHKVAGVPTDWGSEPLQFASEVFRIRDRLAHGRSERVLGPVVPDADAAQEAFAGDGLQPDWYRAITLEWVIEAKQRYRNLMVYFGELFGYHESDHLLQSTGGVVTHDEDDA